MHDLTNAALDYLAAGLHLIALDGKRPNIRYHETWDWANSIHGLPETDEDMQALDDLFGDATVTGVAILIPEHVLVADVDSDAAADLFQQLAGSIEQWDTRVARTPHGLHIWYLSPGADASVWVGGRTLLLKGFGGYVVAPPSRVGNGVYTWAGDWAKVDWLPDGIKERLKFERALDNVQTVFDVPSSSSLVVEMAEGRWTGKGWADWNIDGLAKAIREAADGNQNNVIAWAAMQARDEGVPLEVAMTHLLTAAIEGNHPEHRARTTIRGAYKRGARG